MNELEQFLNDTDKGEQVDVLDQPLNPEEDPAKGATEATGELDTTEEDKGGEAKPRNRRERRLMKQLADEKTSAAFLAGKLAARSEAERSLTEEADYLKGLERIYGTDTPEAQIATDLLKKAIAGARDEAEQRAFARLQELQTKEEQEVKAAGDELDSFIDDIEETYGVTLTEPQEKAFFQMLGKMSPKDAEGRITDYADPHAVWEVFQEKLNSKKPDTRAKNLASRSMVQSTTATTHSGGDPIGKYLRENGII